MVELDVVEDEELGLGSEEGGVGHAGAGEVFLGALGDAARVAGVEFAGAGFGRRCRSSERVGSAMKGSMKAVSGSGMASMSLASMLFQPRMLEPSKPRPSVKISSVSSRIGQVKCCHVPKVFDKLDVEHLGAALFG